MFIKGSKDDDQVFMLVVGAGTRHRDDEHTGLGNTFAGLLAIAITMVVVVGLLKEAEQQRWQDQPMQAIAPERLQPIQSMPSPDANEMNASTRYPSRPLMRRVHRYQSDYTTY